MIPRFHLPDHLRRRSGAAAPDYGASVKVRSRAGHGSRAGYVGVAIAMVALIISMSGVAGAARRTVARLVDGHALSTKAKRNAIPVLGKNGKLPAAMIPSVNAAKLGGKTRKQLTAACPAGTVDVGTWCLMLAPYQLSQSEQVAGVNNFVWASRACETLGGFLPSAAELVGAANRVRLESTVDDDSASATVQGGDPGTPAANQREMSSTLITTAAGSDAAGSEGVSSDTVVDPDSGQPQPVGQDANPMPDTLQYVTVYDNYNQGGFAGSEPVSTPENFRCGFYLKQK
jgi:hypothetical protein